MSKELIKMLGALKLGQKVTNIVTKMALCTFADVFSYRFRITILVTR